MNSGQIGAPSQMSLNQILNLGVTGMTRVGGLQLNQGQPQQFNKQMVDLQLASSQNNQDGHVTQLQVVNSGQLQQQSHANGQFNPGQVNSLPQQLQPQNLGQSQQQFNQSISMRGINQSTFQPNNIQLGNRQQDQQILNQFNKSDPNKKADSPLNKSNERKSIQQQDQQKQRMIINPNNSIQQNVEQSYQSKADSNQQPQNKKSPTMQLSKGSSANPNGQGMTKQQKELQETIMYYDQKIQLLSNQLKDQTQQQMMLQQRAMQSNNVKTNEDKSGTPSYEIQQQTRTNNKSQDKQDDAQLLTNPLQFDVHQAMLQQPNKQTENLLSNQIIFNNLLQNQQQQQQLNLQNLQKLQNQTIGQFQNPSTYTEFELNRVKQQQQMLLGQHNQGQTATSQLGQAGLTGQNSSSIDPVNINLQKLGFAGNMNNMINNANNFNVLNLGGALASGVNQGLQNISTLNSTAPSAGFNSMNLNMSVNMNLNNINTLATGNQNGINGLQNQMQSLSQGQNMPQFLAPNSNAQAVIQGNGGQGMLPQSAAQAQLSQQQMSQGNNMTQGRNQQQQ